MCLYPFIIHIKTKQRSGVQMKIKDVLRSFGEKKAVQSIAPRCFPNIIFQPKPPAKIKALINKAE